MTFVFNVPSPSTTFVFSTANITFSSGGTCADATVENSDATYTNTVASGGTLVTPDITVNIDNSVGNYYSNFFPSVKDVTVTLADTQYDIYVDGVFAETVYLPALQDDTININAV